MSSIAYSDIRFLKHIEGPLNIIVEVGSRYGDESLVLSDLYPNADIYSFECNPNTVEQCKTALANRKNIHFFDCALGSTESVQPFFSYTKGNDGASSLYRRIDADETQVCTGEVKIQRLDSILIDNTIDLLCVDVQGYELEVLKGTNLNKVRYIIQEEPNPIINTTYLPEGVHSKYVSAPSSEEIKAFMNMNGFEEVERISENYIEDNVLWINKNYHS
jgi:FkbM family methyltransferase